MACLVKPKKKSTQKLIRTLTEHDLKVLNICTDIYVCMEDELYTFSHEISRISRHNNGFLKIEMRYTVLRNINLVFTSGVVREFCDKAFYLFIYCIWKCSFGLS